MTGGLPGGASGPRALISTEDFRPALHSGQVLLHYQPQVELASGAVTGAEALMRWQHPEAGLLLPDHFLPEMLHTPLMPTITGWALGTACVAAMRWSPQQRVAVNITAQDVAGPTLVTAVTDALQASGLSPERLTLEITEHALVHDLDHATRNLQELTDRGVRVSLDDFGTGYSSLLYLRELPINEIKIDSRFIAGLGSVHDDDAIVEGLIHLARAVDVDVVAEGVETRGQAERLASLGCRAAQGYFYGAATAVLTPPRVVVTFPPEAAPASAPSPPRRPRSRGRRPELADADTQQAIRDLLDQGASLHTIAAALNRQGYKTTDGARWVAATVGRAVTALNQ